jgi:tRNA splicing ligase
MILSKNPKKQVPYCAVGMNRTWDLLQCENQITITLCRISCEVKGN